LRHFRRGGRSARARRAAGRPMPAGSPRASASGDPSRGAGAWEQAGLPPLPPWSSASSKCNEIAPSSRPEHADVDVDARDAVDVVRELERHRALFGALTLEYAATKVPIGRGPCAARSSADGSRHATSAPHRRAARGAVCSRSSTVHIERRSAFQSRLCRSCLREDGSRATPDDAKWLVKRWGQPDRPWH
jgi:hypothetical protein